MTFVRMLRQRAAEELECLLAEDMDYFNGKSYALPLDEVPYRVCRPQAAYPSDFDRRPLLQATGQEWDFRPSEERCD